MTDCGCIDVTPSALNEAALDETAGVKAWLAVVSVALGTFSTVTTEFLPVGVLRDVAPDLHVTVGTAGMMVTMPAIASAIASPLLMMFSGKIDRQKLMIGLMALLVVSNVMSALAPNFAIMLIGRLLLGIAHGGFWSMAASLAERLVPKQHVPRAMTIILSGISIGTIVGVPAGVMLSSLVGWRMTFGIVAILAAIVVIKQLLVLPSLPTVTAVRLGDFGRAVKSRVGIIGILAIFFLFNAQFGGYTYITPFLKSFTQASESVVAILLFVYGLAGVSGNFIAGLFVPRSLRGTYAMTALMMALGALLLPILGHTVPGTLLPILGWGVAFGAMPLCVQMWALKSTPDSPESAAAVLNMATQTCIATGAAWGGLVVDHFGTPTVMIASAVLSAAGLATLLIGGSGPKGTVTKMPVGH